MESLCGVLQAMVFISEDTQGNDGATGFDNVALDYSRLLVLELLLYMPGESGEIRVERQRYTMHSSTTLSS